MLWKPKNKCRPGGPLGLNLDFTVFFRKLGFAVYINLYKTLQLVSFVSLLQAEANDLRIQQANTRARDILRNC